MYKIIFDDKTEFIGGEPDNSKWNDMPNKPIVELQYTFGGKTIYLKNYEAYNHQIKLGFLPFNNQKTIILAIIIMVLEKGNVGRIIFDFPNKRIIKDIIPFGQEYNNKPASGWKRGIIEGTPRSYFL